MDPEQKLGKYFSKDWSRERPEVRPWRPGEALGGGPALPLAAPRLGRPRWRPLPLVPLRPEAGSKRAAQLLRPELSAERGEAVAGGSWRGPLSLSAWPLFSPPQGRRSRAPFVAFLRVQFYVEDGRLIRYVRATGAP